MIRAMRHPSELSISAVAERFGMSLRTLRFYEEIGLIRVNRVGARRYYGETAIRRLAVIQKLKLLEVPLDEVKILLERLDQLDPAEADAALRRAVGEAIARAESRIAELRARIEEVRADFAVSEGVERKTVGERA